MAVHYVGTNSSDGTCIGKTTSDKVAFFASTPIDQEVAIADATDAATAITQLNLVIASLENYGLLAS
jgi:hypothetical protein